MFDVHQHYSNTRLHVEDSKTFVIFFIKDKLSRYFQLLKSVNY